MLNKPADQHWDQKLTGRLVEKGLTWEQARVVVGIVAEERQTADHDGYVRGFNDGAESEQKKRKGA